MSICKQIIENSIDELKHCVDCYISNVSRHNYDSMDKAFNHAKNMINRYSSGKDKKEYMARYADIYCGETVSPYFFETDSFTVCLFDTDFTSKGFAKKYRGVDNLHAIFQFIWDIDDGEHSAGNYIIRSYNDSNNADYFDKPITL